MNKKRGQMLFVILIIISISIIITSFTSADIFLSKSPEATYNLGDTMSVVIGSDGSEGWASVDLVCDNQSRMIYFRYLTDESAIEILAPFTKDFLRGMGGNCYLSLNFNGKKKDSLGFKISDAITVSIIIEGNDFNPGDIINYSGTTIKPNQKPIDSGYAELKFDSINLAFIEPVRNNNFAGSFAIPQDLPMGKYDFSVYVSEKDKNDDVTNYGTAKGSITIKQKPTILTISSATNVTPGNGYDFKSSLYDQSNNLIEKKPVAYIIKDVNEKEILKKLSSTDETNTLSLNKDAPMGYWKINAESEGIVNELNFFVQENMEASFELTNDTLKIRNVGNVPYTRKVEMKIGNVTNFTYLNLSIGGVVEFSLSAPNGNYDIGVSDGYQAKDWKGVPLTGSATFSFGTSKRGTLGFFNRNIFAWAFLIAILGLFVLLSARKIINKNFVVNAKDRQDRQYSEIKKTEAKGGVIKVSTTNDGKSTLDINSGYLTYSPIIDGTKQTAVLLSIKLKNTQEIKTNPSMANEYLKKAVQFIIDNKGKIYKTEDYTIGLFLPSITKSFENEMLAIKTAKTINERLKDYNLKFSQKINFGIGVNLGEIIIKRENEKILFNALGSTLSNAKKIADISSSEILLGEEVQRKIGSKVKTALNNNSSLIIKTYKLIEIIERDQNAKFIESFLERNKDYKTLRDYRENNFNSSDRQIKNQNEIQRTNTDTQQIKQIQKNQVDPNWNKLFEKD